MGLKVGQSGQRQGWGISGTLAILSSSKDMAFLPNTLHMFHGNSGHLTYQEGPKPSMECLKVREVGSGKEDNKDDEEDNEDEEDFDHEPSIGGD